MAASEQALKSGPASAAILAAGIGSFVFGLVSLLTETIDAIGNFLNWIKPVGDLSGKSIVSVVLWLVAWVIFGSAWKGRDIPIVRCLVITAVLLVVGLVFTFPPFFEMVKGGE
jgi:hypothetical protein